jgi:type III secretion protein T
MDGFDIIHYLSVNALIISLAATRVAVIFLLLPLFSSELVPPLVRNAFFLALALLASIVQPLVDLSNLSTIDWVLLFVKEGMVGIVIGVFFGIFLWAFETAGQVIDNQIGASVAQVQDPLTGSQTTLIGSFIGRLANYIFVTAGGLMLLSGILLESFYYWPIDQKLPELDNAGLALIGAEFSYYFQLAMLIAAPMIIAIFLIDIMMGLINRYAQQFNVFFLSLSLKMLAAISMLFITIITLVELLIYEIGRHYEQLQDILMGLLTELRS